MKMNEEKFWLGCFERQRHQRWPRRERQLWLFSLFFGISQPPVGEVYTKSYGQVVIAWNLGHLQGRCSWHQKWWKWCPIFFWRSVGLISFISFISFRLLQDLEDVQILRHVFSMHVLGIDANGQLKLIRFCTGALVVWGWVMGHLGRRCLKKALVSVPLFFFCVFKCLSSVG